MIIVDAMVVSVIQSKIQIINKQVKSTNYFYESRRKADRATTCQHAVQASIRYKYNIS